MIKYKQMGKWYVNYIDLDPHDDVPPLLSLFYVSAHVNRILRKMPIRY